MTCYSYGFGINLVETFATSIMAAWSAPELLVPLVKMEFKCRFGDFGP